MNNNLEVNYRNPIILRRLGLEILKKEFGAVGMARFIRQFDIGYGDYTKDKQQELDGYTIEDISKMIEDMKK